MMRTAFEKKLTEVLRPSVSVNENMMQKTRQIISEELHRNEYHHIRLSEYLYAVLKCGGWKFLLGYLLLAVFLFFFIFKILGTARFDLYTCTLLLKLLSAVSAFGSILFIARSDHYVMREMEMAASVSRGMYFLINLLLPEAGCMLLLVVAAFTVIIRNSFSEILLLSSFFPYLCLSAMFFGLIIMKKQYAIEKHAALLTLIMTGILYSTHCSADQLTGSVRTSTAVISCLLLSIVVIAELMILYRNIQYPHFQEV